MPDRPAPANPSEDWYEGQEFGHVDAVVFIRDVLKDDDLGDIVEMALKNIAEGIRMGHPVAHSRRIALAKLLNAYREKEPLEAPDIQALLNRAIR